MWFLISTGGVLLVVILALLFTDRRRISDGPIARDTSTNYRHLEQQANSIRNQSSGPLG